MQPGGLVFKAGEDVLEKEIIFRGAYGLDESEHSVKLSLSKPEGHDDHVLSEDSVTVTFAKAPPPTLKTKTVALMPMIEVSRNLTWGLSTVNVGRFKENQTYGYSMPNFRYPARVDFDNPHNDEFTVRVIEGKEKQNPACLYPGKPGAFIEDLKCIPGKITYLVRKYQQDLAFPHRAIRPYFVSDTDKDPGERLKMYTQDYEPVTLTLEIKNLRTGTKSHESLTITGADPERRKKCHRDHPKKNAARYTCLYKQGIPSPGVDDSDISTLRSNLPLLTQKKANYDLVFREEFNNSDIEELGKRWDGYLAGAICSKVEGGYYKYSKKTPCKTLSGDKIDSGLTTRGKFEFRYGYFEVKYQIAVPKIGKKTANVYTNLSFFLQGPLAYYGHPHWVEHGIDIDSYEESSKYMGYEIDLYEYVAKDRTSYSHKYLLVPGIYYNPDKSPKFIPYRVNRITTYTAKPGTDLEIITIRHGLEWTPEGYREFTDGYSTACG